MIDCIGFDTTIQLLLDGELTGEELERACAHLVTCEACAEKLAEEEKFSKLLRSSYVPQTASSMLHDRVLQVIQTASSVAPDDLAKNPVTSGPISLVRRRPFSIAQSRGQLLLVAAAILICFILLPFVQNRVRANSFIDLAISEDRSLSAHLIPLDVQSNSPNEVTNWFASRVDFPFRLPNAGMASDEDAKYTLAGGRLVSFKGENAALIDFHLADERISLLIASDKLARAEGGSVTMSDGVALHRRQRKEHNIVTWDNKGLTYAMVIPAKASRDGKCAACHQNSRPSAQAQIHPPQQTEPDFLQPASSPTNLHSAPLYRFGVRELRPAACRNSANLCNSYTISPPRLLSVALQNMALFRKR
ncbi:zf-HC2 domain-containing protein [Terriglobus saanensis]|uniref:Putative zinc-finger domain-containing protein n=1 Tax=Terriglobus saanensis (strain ATCC BAA-1853 / DSM 23119 / SP1PR4) TaxID=401053 RepID=E8V7W1_TERSS|nr:zf-HC2 domain-containing protein [Terriglobus saanensis]ADV82885.1 hypothetical protein AciPR4_2081 [Terriglobus saanensis SP1PR4]